MQHPAIQSRIFSVVYGTPNGSNISIGSTFCYGFFIFPAKPFLAIYEIALCLWKKTTYFRILRTRSFSGQPRIQRTRLNIRKKYDKEKFNHKYNN